MMKALTMLAQVFLLERFLHIEPIDAEYLTHPFLIIIEIHIYLDLLMVVRQFGFLHG